MNCNCKINSFSYETLEKDGDDYVRVRIYKCGTLLSDGKKKTRCGFSYRKVLKSGIIIKQPDIVKIKYIKPKIDSLENICRKKIDYYIHLCNITKDVYLVKKGTYHANINYNLSILKYKLFFEETETINELLIRLKSPPDDIFKIKQCNKIYKPVKNNKTKGIKKINILSKEVGHIECTDIVADEETNIDDDKNSIKSMFEDFNLDVDDSDNDNEDDEEAFSD